MWVEDWWDLRRMLWGLDLTRSVAMTMERDYRYCTMESIVSMFHVLSLRSKHCFRRVPVQRFVVWYVRRVLHAKKHHQSPPRLRLVFHRFHERSFVGYWTMPMSSVNDRFHSCCSTHRTHSKPSVTMNWHWPSSWDSIAVGRLEYSMHDIGRDWSDCDRHRHRRDGWWWSRLDTAYSPYRSTRAPWRYPRASSCGFEISPHVHVYRDCARILDSKSKRASNELKGWRGETRQTWLVIDGTRANKKKEREVQQRKLDVNNKCNQMILSLLWMTTEGETDR